MSDQAVTFGDVDGGIAYAVQRHPQAPRHAQAVLGALRPRPRSGSLAAAAMVAAIRAQEAQMYSTELTVRGNVVDEPRVHITDSGHMVVNFRLASTERRHVRETNDWVDGNRLFLSISCWRTLAEHVAASVHKGQPVIVHGRLYSREYERDGQNRLEYKLDADSVGHDMSRGRSTFTKSAGAAGLSVELDEDGMPPLLDGPDAVGADRRMEAPALVGG